MRFHQLAIGERFEFEGATYVKIKALTALSEAGGGERFIRRSAEVRVVAGSGQSAPGGVRVLQPDVVLQAFDAFYDHCVQCIEAARSDGFESAAAQPQCDLAQARQRFLRRLALPSRR
jgi:hypothetical protein